MTGPPEKISGRAILSDIRAGMDNNSLMKKYRVTGEQLTRVLKTLLTAGVLKRSEYDLRVPPDPKKLVPTFTCTECGTKHTKRFIRCPVCGVKAPSFRYEDDAQPEAGAGPNKQPRNRMCWFCGKRRPSDKAAVVKTLIAHYHANPNGNVTFDDTRITIPRCATCQSNHAKIDSLDGSLKELDSEIARIHASWDHPVSARTEKAQPFTVVVAITGGLSGFWAGLQVSKLVGLTNLWSQVGLGISSGLAMLTVLFVVLDSWLLPRLRRASSSPPSRGPDADRARQTLARIAQLMERRDHLEAQRIKLTVGPRPQSEWVDSPEARTLLQNGWEDDLDRPGLGALRLKAELDALSKASRTRNSD